MGRLNAFVADNHLGDGVNVGEKATLASQRAIRNLRETQGLKVKQIGASIRNGQQGFDLCGMDVQTIPTGAAESFQDMQPRAEDVKNRTGDDPSGTRNETTETEPIEAFWKIDDNLKKAVDALAADDIGKMSGDQIRAGLAACDAGSIFPELDSVDQAKVIAEGKIPVFKSWQARVAGNTAAWDGMLTAAALASFSVDQAAFDDRVRKYI
jgi:transaldolase